jgi:hypothetical protein
MSTKYKKVRDFEEYQDNPFIEKAIEEIKVVKKTQVMRTENKDEIQMIVNNDGEVEGYSAFMRFIEVDEERFAKIYLNQFGAFWDLSKPAIRVFGYIITILKPKQDSFIFDMQSCLEYTKYNTEKSIFEGIGALIVGGIIARSNKHYKYFINPLIVFNGSRITFAKTYIKKKKDSDSSQMSLPLYESKEEI